MGPLRRHLWCRTQKSNLKGKDFKKKFDTMLFSIATQRAMDCGSHNPAGLHANTSGHIIFTWLKAYFNARAFIFYVCVCEGLSQPVEPI